MAGTARSIGPASGSVRNQYSNRASVQQSSAEPAHWLSTARARRRTVQSAGVADSTASSMPRANQSMAPGSHLVAT